MRLGWRAAAPSRTIRQRQSAARCLVRGGFRVLGCAAVGRSSRRCGCGRPGQVADRRARGERRGARAGGACRRSSQAGLVAGRGGLAGSGAPARRYGARVGRGSPRSGAGERGRARLRWAGARGLGARDGDRSRPRGGRASDGPRRSRAARLERARAHDNPRRHDDARDDAPPATAPTQGGAAAAKPATAPAKQGAPTPGATPRPPAEAAPAAREKE